jgi:hypothetical protein
MEILLNILHFQNHRIPEDLDLVTFGNFAMVCDKYNCAKAVSLAADTWLKALRPKAGDEGLTSVVIAYVFDNPIAFKHLTKYLVLNSAETFLDPKLEGGIDELLPLQVYGK